MTQDRWQATIKGARDSFGALVARVRTTAASVRTLPGVPDGDYVVLHYTTSFVKKKDADETLTQSRAADGVWRMVGYSLR